MQRELIRRPGATQRRNLAIVCAGDQSDHRTWFRPDAARNYDLMVVYYGSKSSNYGADADIYLARQGPKYALLHLVSRVYSKLLRSYDFIWCPDDDIAAEVGQVDQLFEIARAWDLEIAQPAISAGEMSFEALRQVPGSLLRFSPFVEVMCPLFRRDTFFRFSPMFPESRSGWGLDMVWSKHVPRGKIAIIDAVGMRHTRPLFSGKSYEILAERGVDPFEEKHRVSKKYGGIRRRQMRHLSDGRTRMETVPLGATSEAYGLRRLAWRFARLWLAF